MSSQYCVVHSASGDDCKFLKTHAIVQSTAACTKNVKFFHSFRVLLSYRFSLISFPYQLGPKAQGKPNADFNSFT